MLYLILVLRVSYFLLFEFTIVKMIALALLRLSGNVCLLVLVSIYFEPGFLNPLLYPFVHFYYFVIRGVLNVNFISISLVVAVKCSQFYLICVVYLIYWLCLTIPHTLFILLLHLCTFLLLFRLWLFIVLILDVRAIIVVDVGDLG